MARFQTRRFLLVGALIGLPLLLLGVAPALQDLINRMNALEGQVQTLEAALGGDDLRVFDANGVEIGRFIDASLASDSGVTIYLEELAVIARFSSRGNLERTVSALYYSHPDCQGQPFLGEADPIVANALLNGWDRFLVISRGGLVEIPLASVLKGSACSNRGEPFGIVPVVSAEVIYDPAELGLSLPLAVPLVVAPAAGGP